MNIYSLKEYTLISKKRYIGDLLHMTGAPNNKNYYDPDPILKFKNKTSYKTKKLKQIQSSGFVTTNEMALNKLTVLVFRDSFTTSLQPYYSETFEKVIFIKGSYSQNLVDKFKPDIVIDVFVERFVDGKIISHLN